MGPEIRTCVATLGIIETKPLKLQKGKYYNPVIS